MGQLKRKSEMPPARRWMIEAIRKSECAACGSEKPPITAFCDECLDKLGPTRRKRLNGPLFYPEYQSVWYRSLALLGGDQPEPDLKEAA